MKNFRRILGLILSLMLIGALAVTATAEGQPLKVYAVSVMSGGAAWGQYEVGFNKACEELGYEGHYLAPQSFNSAAELVNLTETAITNGANIILPRGGGCGSLCGCADPRQGIRHCTGGYSGAR